MAALACSNLGPGCLAAIFILLLYIAIVVISFVLYIVVLLSIGVISFVLYIVVLLSIVVMSFVLFIVLYLALRLGADQPAGAITTRPADGRQGGCGSGRS